MKNLYLIAGPMGVGKTTACLQLEQLLPRCAFLDGDWCWHMHPFQVTEATKAMVLDNICHVLNNFLACRDFENVVFCWVMHQREIWQALRARLRCQGWRVHPLCLVCSPAELRRRVESDPNRGENALGRSLEYLPLYKTLALPVLDVTGLSAKDTARAILARSTAAPNAAAPNDAASGAAAGAPSAAPLPTPEALERLARFEAMARETAAQQEQLSQKLALLRTAGKERTAQFRELLAQKLTNAAVLSLLQAHGLLGAQTPMCKAESNAGYNSSINTGTVTSESKVLTNTSLDANTESCP